MTSSDVSFSFFDFFNDWDQATKNPAPEWSRVVERKTGSVFSQTLQCFLVHMTRPFLVARPHAAISGAMPDVVIV